MEYVRQNVKKDNETNFQIAKTVNKIRKIEITLKTMALQDQCLGNEM